MNTKREGVRDGRHIVFASTQFSSVPSISEAGKIKTRFPDSVLKQLGFRKLRRHEVRILLAQSKTGTRAKSSDLQLTMNYSLRATISGTGFLMVAEVDAPWVEPVLGSSSGSHLWKTSLKTVSSKPPILYTESLSA